MRVDVEALGQGLDRCLAQRLLHERRASLRELVGERAAEDVLPPHEGVGDLGREVLAEQVGDTVSIGSSHHIGRTPLQHGDRRCGLGQCGDEGHRRRPAPDHHDLLRRRVEVLRPVLRVDERSDEALLAGERRTIPSVVAVVARAPHDEPTGHLPSYPGLGILDGDGPHRGVARERRRNRLGVVGDVLLDAVGRGGVADVVQDRWTVGDGLGVSPRFEAPPEGEHVRVRTNGWVAEEIPRST